MRCHAKWTHDYNIYYLCDLSLTGEINGIAPGTSAKWTDGIGHVFLVNVILTIVYTNMHTVKA